jgi:hypothetical protein
MSNKAKRCEIKPSMLLKYSKIDFQDKKMPRTLRIGANPPFQRVEETKGSHKKARLFAIVMAVMLHCSSHGVSK